MPSRETGEAAERRALDYLTRQGLKLVAANYRSRFGEIDLVMRDGEVLVFAEVRMRKSAAAQARVSPRPSKRV